MYLKNLLVLRDRQARSGTLPPAVQIAFAGMEVVDLYLLGHLSLDQANEQLVARGHHRVLTSIRQVIS